MNYTTHLIIKIPYSVDYTSVGIEREPNIFNFFMEFSINFSISLLLSFTPISYNPAKPQDITWEFVYYGVFGYFSF